MVRKDTALIIKSKDKQSTTVETEANKGQKPGTTKTKTNLKRPGQAHGATTTTSGEMENGSLEKLKTKSNQNSHYKWSPMTKRETQFFLMFIIGVGLLGISRGWGSVAWNLGAGTLLWMLGYAIADAEQKKRQQR